MEEINHLPPGFRFYPTDEELISHYLAKKAANRSFTPKAVADVDLNKFEPWDLPDKASMESQKEWYFFNVKDRKYPTGLRTNRATQAGYWKTTGKDKEIIRDGVLIGMKKTLVFYQGRAPKGIKSNWVMHEYRLESYNHSHKSMKDEWVVCRVFKKAVSAKRPHHPVSSLSPDSPPSETNSIENITDCIDHRTEMARTTRLNSIADSSSRVSISSVPSCNAPDNNTGHHDSIISELSHYSRLGAMSSDVSMDYSNLLLKTLQLRSLQQRDHQAMNDIAGLCSSLILHHQQPAGSDIPTNNINLHQTILGLGGLQQPNWNPFS